MSSAEPPNSMATATSWMVLPASRAMMWAPKTRSVSASARILTKPSSSKVARARELAIIENLPDLYLMPAAFSSSSVLPMEATSGWV